MATLEENIAQAIADFDDIESAIEEQGVDVPYGTDTAEYGNLIRSIKGVTVEQSYNPKSANAQSGTAVAEALASLHITYLESLDNTNYQNLYDLASGTYILYGTFLVYPNATKKFVFSKRVLVSVSHGTLSTCLQVFYPPYNTIQYLNIWQDEESETGYTYERKDAQLYYMESVKNKVTAIDETATDEQYPSALAVREAIENAVGDQEIFCNALKATASGEVIRVDDVSPIEHTVKAKVKSKNLAIRKNPNTTVTTEGITYTVNADGTITANGTATGTAYYLMLGNTNYETQVPIKRGRYTVAIAPVQGCRISIGLRLDENSERILYYSTYVNTVTFDVTTDTARFDMILCVDTGHTITDAVFKPQLEEGDTATEYEPYIDPTTVTVTRYGVDETDNSQTYTPNADGTCEITSLSPTMTLFTDTEGVTIDLEYNQDSNKAFNNVNADLEELDRVTAAIATEVGDVETALDGIIAIQTALIGG